MARRRAAPSIASSRMASARRSASAAGSTAVPEAKARAAWDSCARLVAPVAPAELSDALRSAGSSACARATRAPPDPASAAEECPLRPCPIPSSNAAPHHALARPTARATSDPVRVPRRARRGRGRNCAATASPSRWRLTRNRAPGRDTPARDRIRRSTPPERSRDRRGHRTAAASARPPLQWQAASRASRSSESGCADRSRRWHARGRRRPRRAW